MYDDRELQWLAITSFEADRICPCVDHVAGNNFGVPCPLPESELHLEQILPAHNGATRIYRFPTRASAEGFARSISHHFHCTTEFKGVRYRLVLMGVGEGVVGRDGYALRNRAGRGKSDCRGLPESTLPTGESRQPRAEFK